MKVESLVNQIKQCGQSLIDNAEMIAKTYKYQTDLSIIVNVGMCGDEVPSISISKDFIPEGFNSDAQNGEGSDAI